MMNNCEECVRPTPTYRVVQNISERNTIPCNERMNGMVVTVVGIDNSYKQYMLQGGDPCVNTNWKTINLNPIQLNSYIGHITIYEETTDPVTNTYLSNRFPESLEGFRVTIVSLNTTFMRIQNDTWVITNNIQI